MHKLGSVSLNSSTAPVVYAYQVYLLYEGFVINPISVRLAGIFRLGLMCELDIVPKVEPAHSSSARTTMAVLSVKLCTIDNAETPSR